MSSLIVLDCEAPLGVGAPSVGEMTEFGGVDVNALRDGRVETAHGTDCSEDTFRHFREWLGPRMPIVFVSDNPACDFQWINFYFWRYFGHDLRRTAATKMAEAGVPRHHISAVLNHVEGGARVTRVYDRYSYDAEKRKALETWARTLQSIIEQAEPGRVLPFGSAVR